MGTTTSADGVSLIKTQPKIPSPSYRNPAMGDTSFRVLPSPNPKQPQLRPRGMIERSGFVLPANATHSTRHNASFHA